MKFHRASLLLGALVGATLAMLLGSSNDVLQGILAIVTLIDLLFEAVFQHAKHNQNERDRT